MSNISVEQADAILTNFDGTLPQKKQHWTETYNFTVWPPPPFEFNTQQDMAQYIADNYTGPVIGK
jgi:hypothetical protein